MTLKVYKNRESSKVCLVRVKMREENMCFSNFPTINGGNFFSFLFYALTCFPRFLWENFLRPIREAFFGFLRFNANPSNRENNFSCVLRHVMEEFDIMLKIISFYVWNTKKAFDPCAVDFWSQFDP
jgi:hypothetical protein